jgi:hypothetical protein
MLARPQSTWSCSLSRTSIARCSFCQTPLASHTPTVAQNLGDILQRNACLLHKQDAVENGFIAHRELTYTAFGTGAKAGIRAAAIATVLC